MARLPAYLTAKPSVKTFFVLFWEGGYESYFVYLNKFQLKTFVESPYVNKYKLISIE